MKLGFWSGQRKSTLWCFWFYFSKALKVIISCCWIPMAVVPHSFISGLQSFTQRTGLIQARPALVSLGTSWRQLGLWLEDCVYAPGPCSVHQAALGEGRWWPGFREHCEPSKVPPLLQVYLGCELEGHAMKLWIVSFHFHRGMMDPWGSERRKWVGRWCKWWSSLCPSSPSPHLYSKSWTRSPGFP